MESHSPLRTLGTFSLMMSSITCIIGSGWLFGAYNAAKIAGPASIIAWLIGAIVIAMIAMTVIELAVLFPKSGGMVRYLNYSHGSLAGFISAWAGWLAIVSVIPAEATASIQYLGSWNNSFCQHLYNAHCAQLTNFGVIAAIALIFVYFLINYWTVKLLMRFITFVTVIKIAVPLVTIGILFFTSFHGSNFGTTYHEFVPYGWSSILKAVATCGIIFTFNGFQTPLNFAGEAKRPRITLPVAVISAILIAAVIYILLQVAFIGAISPSTLAQGFWNGLSFTSPFAELAISLNLNVLLITIYVDAFISPSATGMTYMGTTTRMLYGMQQHGSMPDFLGKLHEKYLIPRGALWVNFGVSLLFVYFCRSWVNLVGVISIATVVSFLAGPIAVMGLRRIGARMKHGIRIPGLSVAAPLAFILVSLVFFWSCWPLTGEILLVLAVGLVIYFYYEHKRGWKDFACHFNASLWLILYLVAMAFLSYLGSDTFGGMNIIPQGWDELAVIISAGGFYMWGVRSAWYTPELVEVMQGSKKTVL